MPGRCRWKVMNVDGHYFRETTADAWPFHDDSHEGKWREWCMLRHDEWVLFRHIEWAEFECDKPLQILRRLDALAKFDAEATESGIRVYAYR